MCRFLAFRNFDAWKPICITHNLMLKVIPDKYKPEQTWLQRQTKFDSYYEATILKYIVSASAEIDQYLFSFS